MKPAAHLAFATGDSGGADQLDGIAQRRLHSDAREDGESLFAHLHILLLAAESKADIRLGLERRHRARRDDGHRLSPDLEDLLRLFFGVRRRDDDEQAIQQVNGDAVRALVIGAADTEAEVKHMLYERLFTFLKT